MMKSAHACEAFGQPVKNPQLRAPPAQPGNVCSMWHFPFATPLRRDHGPANLLGIGMADLPTVNDNGFSLLHKNLA